MKTIKLKSRDSRPGNYTGIVEHEIGDKHWYVNGKLHREDGPAVECSNGAKQWLIDDKFHRIDGPARELTDGTKEWWIEGKFCVDKINTSKKVFLGKEKGKYGLEWMKFMTETRVEEIPMIPGIREHVIERDPDLAHYFDEYEWI